MSNFNIQLKYKPCTIEILSLEDSRTVINYKQGVFNAYRHLFGRQNDTHNILTN